MLTEDATHLDWLARVRATRIRHRIRRRVPAPASNQRRGLFGATDLATGAWRYHVARKRVSVVFCYFLERLLAAYPDVRWWRYRSTTTPPTPVTVCGIVGLACQARNPT